MIICRMLLMPLLSITGITFCNQCNCCELKSVAFLWWWHCSLRRNHDGLKKRKAMGWGGGLWRNAGMQGCNYESNQKSSDRPQIQFEWLERNMDWELQSWIRKMKNINFFEGKWFTGVHLFMLDWKSYFVICRYADFFFSVCFSDLIKCQSMVKKYLS